MSIPTPPVNNPNINTTFTVALQFITSGQNFRNVKGNQTIGLPVINNYEVTTLSISASASQTVNAYQLISIVSDTSLNVTATPDETSTISNPGSSTQSGFVFVFSGSFLTSGVTLYNPTSNTATVQVALVS
ncbi:MAG: hypothetical protein KGH75_03875 [Rhodospirillales bacterium]|nr:hypothetical protein [Rhodospirillales bacterium]